MKAHRSDLDDLRNFVLVEELEVSGADSQLGRRHSSESVERRILTDDENVYLAQSEWKTNGKFVIMDRHQAETEENPVCGSNMKTFKLVVLIMLIYFVSHCIELCTKFSTQINTIWYKGSVHILYLIVYDFCIRFGSFVLQCEKKRKGFITKGPKSKSLSTGKILIAVRLDIVRQGIDIFGKVISFFGGDILINLKDNWLFVPWMNLDE